MRKKVFSTFLVIVLLLTSVTLFGCSNKKEESLQKIKLNEVVRSVFYAPMYAAINEGFFKEEGIDIDLSTGQGADTTILKTQVYLYFIFTFINNFYKCRSYMWIKLSTTTLLKFIYSFIISFSFIIWPI